MTAAGLALHPRTLTPTETLVLALASTVLRRSLDSTDAAVPLSALGADSLSIIELAAEAEAATGITLPPDLAHESMTLRDLASWLDRRTGSAAHEEDDPFTQMLADCLLPDDVRPGAARRSSDLLEGEAILITGATGFLGARLAADLLRLTSARLYCLVRGSQPESQARLRSCLIANGADAAIVATRVIAIAADLTRPQLGLEDDEWDRLGAVIDRVLHVGASVNWVASYGALRAANVLGTTELLRLACGPQPIPFHFVSSVSACYAVGGPSEVDESFDPRPHLRGIHLGYAQTKVVGEALVREAGRRGLPVHIYRPSLISGDSRSGAFNAGDLLSLLIRGCVHMGTAPDLDWWLDCEPVDIISAAILRLSAADEPITHLRHRQPRHWRECLLWMRLAGYDIRLSPYAEWTAQLERETRDSADHPLRPLRHFFLHQPAGAGGLALPQLFEESRRSRVSASRTSICLGTTFARPALDAALLDRYFTAYRSNGYLPSPSASASKPRGAGPALDASFFEAALANRGLRRTVGSAELISAGSDHSIVSELTAWRSGQAAGLFRYRLTYAGSPLPTDVVVKLKPHAEDVIAVGAAVAGLCGDAIGEAYRRWSDRIGFTGSHLRERAVYESHDLGLTGHIPALLGVLELDSRGACALVLEDLSGAALLDSIDRTPAWDAGDIDVAIRGLADIHAASAGRTGTLLNQPWLEPRRSSASMIEMAGLWQALADHAAPAFTRWAGSTLPAIHRASIASIGEWRPFLDDSPQVLIHNDCNPRNLCLRECDGQRRLCAYDWELAAIGAPQRDLAEFLCFVLPESATDQTIAHWSERHRIALAQAAGITIPAATWRRGLLAAMRELLIDRLAMYALVQRIRPQPFLPRVIASWMRIHGHLMATSTEFAC